MKHPVGCTARVAEDAAIASGLVNGMPSATFETGNAGVKPFGEWNQVFPNAGCVVTPVDQLMRKRPKPSSSPARAIGSRRRRSGRRATPNPEPRKNRGKPEDSRHRTE